MSGEAFGASEADGREASTDFRLFGIEAKKCGVEPPLRVLGVVAVKNRAAAVKECRDSGQDEEERQPTYDRAWSGEVDEDCQVTGDDEKAKAIKPEQIGVLRQRVAGVQGVAQWVPFEGRRDPGTQEVLQPGPEGCGQEY